MDDIVYEPEYGTSQLVRFPTVGEVTAYDSEGNEIEIPKCEKCGAYKCYAISKINSAWVCWSGCDNEF